MVVERAGGGALLVTYEGARRECDGAYEVISPLFSRAAEPPLTSRPRAFPGYRRVDRRRALEPRGPVRATSQRRRRRAAPRRGCARCDAPARGAQPRPDPAFFTGRSEQEPVQVFGGAARNLT